MNIIQNFSKTKMVNSAKKEKTVSQKKQYLMCFIFTTIFYILNNLCYMSISSNKCESGLSDPTINLILDFIMYFLISLTIDTFVKNIYKTQAIMSFLYYVFSSINYLKLSYSLTPLYIGDVLFLKSGFGEILSLVDSKTVIQTFSGCLYLFLPPIILLIYLKVFKKKIYTFSLNKKFVFIPLLCIITLFIPSIFSLFVDYKDEKFVDSNQYFQHGIFPGMYGEFLLSQLPTPENYNEEEALDIINNYKSNIEADSFGEPNVIVILNESIFDLSKVKDLEFNIDINEDLSYLKSEGTSFNTIVSPYGGRTALAEYEFTTLFNTRYLSESIIPYNKFYTQNANMEEYPSIINIFNKNNYTTSVMAAFDNGEIYKTKYIYPMIGYRNCFYRQDLIDFLDNENKYKGIAYNQTYPSLISTQYLMECVKKQLDEEGKQFIFVKIAESHMPFKEIKYTSKELEFDIKSKSNNFNENELNIMNVYAQGIYDNYKYIRELYNYIQTIDEPTIIITFGDHLPLLKKGNKDLLEKSDLFSYEYLDNTYNKYSTDGLILSNYDINTTDCPNNISLDMLSAYLLKHLDINKEDYSGIVDYMFDNLNIIPATNRFISIKNDVKYETADFILNKEAQEAYHNLENIQYYYLEKDFLTN